jgi:hypothetical protein
MRSMLHALLALAALSSHAATPQAAAIAIVGFGLKKPPVVQRVNVVDRYASVLTSGGMMESSPVTEPILLQHFSFGWQALDVLNSRCRLHSHSLGPRVEDLLTRGMPPIPADERRCTDLKDAGPAAEVEEVRRLMNGPLVPWVVVAGTWAMGEWYGAGGGQNLFQMHGGRWRFAAGGGGAMDVSLMRAHGVPQSDWCRFGIYDANCH